MQKFVPRSRVRMFCNECTRSNPLDPKLTFWCILYYFGAFGTVWLPYETQYKMGPFGCLTKLGAKRPNLCKRSCHEVASECFATNTPDPPHSTLNRRFSVYRTIWVHSGPFGCLTKLGAKRAELVQKFVPRSRVGIFYNECTRSTPFDPKLMFWCVSYYLGVFGTV